MAVHVAEIDAESTYDLRRRVLRGGRPDAVVRFPEDQVPGTIHLSVVEDGMTLAVASFIPESTPHRPESRAVRVRGMAVEPRLQRTGAGRLLLEVATRRLRTEGVEVLWANGRDDALGFYERLGWQVLGGGFTTATGIPHHVVLTDL